MQSYTVAQLGVASLAKVVGFVGLVWGLLVGATWVAVGAVTASPPGAGELAVFVIGSPVYGVVIGGVTAIVYNATASLVGGVELQLASVER